MTKRKLLFTLGLSLVASLAIASGASAQEGPGSDVTDDEINAIASDLYCPICENVPLDVCPTQACEDWRDEIRELLEAGSTETDVQDYFVERYGVRVLGEPPRTGFTALLWIIPVVGLAAGALVFGRSVLQMRRAAPATTRQPTSSQAPPAVADDSSQAEREYAAYVARLERELKDFAL